MFLFIWLEQKCKELIFYKILSCLAKNQLLGKGANSLCPELKQQPLNSSTLRAIRQLRLLGSSII
jgi:hypothetical protein